MQDLDGLELDAGSLWVEDAYANLPNVILAPMMAGANAIYSHLAAQWNLQIAETIAAFASLGTVGAAIQAGGVTLQTGGSLLSAVESIPSGIDWGPLKTLSVASTAFNLPALANSIGLNLGDASLLDTPVVPVSAFAPTAADLNAQAAAAAAAVSVASPPSVVAASIDAAAQSGSNVPIVIAPAPSVVYVPNAVPIATSQGTVMSVADYATAADPTAAAMVPTDPLVPDFGLSIAGINLDVPNTASVTFDASGGIVDASGNPVVAQVTPADTAVIGSDNSALNAGIDAAQAAASTSSTFDVTKFIGALANTYAAVVTAQARGTVPATMANAPTPGLIRTLPDGSTMRTNADGSTSVMSPNGQSYTILPSGKIVQGAAGGLALSPTVLLLGAAVLALLLMKGKGKS
jgi:hypothetical protein